MGIKGGLLGEIGGRGNRERKEYWRQRGSQYITYI
jgi:hypothetical protein